ncbi:MAG: HAMP domain-containing histidine kinase [Defluviitaleaceae bacterium]|nr:HAMP domain-containing histidine kinase [Defluviitaleaceae bacterium]
MRLFAKSFLCTTLIISIALLMLGYLLITSSQENAIHRETQRAQNQFQYDMFTMQANMIDGAALFNRHLLELSGRTVDMSPNGQQVHFNVPAGVDFSLLEKITEHTRAMEFQTIGGATYLIIGGLLTQGDTSLHLLVATDISDIIAQHQLMTHNFWRIYFITLAFSMGLVLVFSAFLTTPIKKMNQAAALIAQGRYDQRLRRFSGDEIGQLAGSFNLMADAVEEKMDALLENARQKEDFVGNFAHELKTPLTSVIGYADMIYQKDLPLAQVKDAAWYILNEGLRLEALSIKLMDLIVLNRQDFVLETVDTQALFADISGSLAPMLADKNVSLRMDIDPATIKVEYDLFKTLMFNLIDNAAKAGGKKIEISGRLTDTGYTMTVADNGRGMPAAELARITEAFYTVDKSRSRRQHGAGIGLSLVAKIADIHGGRLSFNSYENVGTVVKIDLPKEDDYDY